MPFDIARSAAIAGRRMLYGPHSSEFPERASYRHRRIFASAGTALVAKLISVSIGLFTVPLTLHYLGSERYGMWLVMSSFVALLSFADLGIGNGILNIVAAAYGRENNIEIRNAVSSGMTVLVGLGAVIGCAFWIVYPHIDWYRIFNAQTTLARREAGPAIAVFAACFVLAIPTGIVQRVQMALQQSYIANLWSVGGSLISLFGIICAISAEAGLPWLVFAFMSGPLIANSINSLVYFGYSRRDIAPRPASVHTAMAISVMRSGLLFLLLQIAAAVTYNSSGIIIAQMLGAAQVATYAVPERLFGVITLIVSMALQPLWPAYREALVRGDTSWVRRTLRSSMIISFLVAACLSVALVVLTPTILFYWVGSSVLPPTALIVGFGIWKVIEAGGLALAMFLNGAHVVSAQAILASATAATSILLTITLITHIGIAGGIWGMIIAFTFCSAIPYAFLVRGIIGARSLA